MLYLWFRSGRWVKILIILMIFTLGGTLFLQLRRSQRNSQQEKEELRRIAEEAEKEQREQSKADSQKGSGLDSSMMHALPAVPDEPEEAVQVERGSFYQKLADGLPVNILVVGDSIGAGVAADPGDSWSDLLTAGLHSKYGSEISLTNVSMHGNSSYAGYVRIMSLPEDASYDLVIFCYGENDSPVNFGLYYEAMVRTARRRFPEASMICILESSQRKYTEKIKAIQDIAAHYGLAVADTLPAFQVDYESKVHDAIHPNNSGHLLYYDTLMDVIIPHVKERFADVPVDAEMVFPQVEAFDHFEYISADQFIRSKNLFMLKRPVHGTVLGIDFIYCPGINRFQIKIDGEPYTMQEIPFRYSYSQWRINVCNGWLDGDTVDAEHEIRILFYDTGEGETPADGFNGIIVSSE